ncbi:hypothetical protein [Burkholderia sp. BCC0405]|uniref:hypothetical protein n=1 Tax=Burkholderia sp. BCC0405 TaxID=2676298 RepID=UPI00158A0747|nr:hypothetical protein [Burkholderia sp. BCC0405]
MSNPALIATEADALKVLSIMEHGCSYTKANLIATSKIPASRMHYALNRLLSSRRVVSSVRGKLYRYALAEDHLDQSISVQSSRMTSHLVGYEVQMRETMALRMLARAPIAAITSHESFDTTQAKQKQPRARKT